MTKRLRILSTSEIKYYYGAQAFSPDEQEYYFTLDTHEESIMQELGSVISKAYFILLLGYFKANQQLFKLWEIKNINSNLEFVRTKYFPERQKSIDLEISRPTRLDLEHRILKMFDYQVCGVEMRERIALLASEVVTIDSSPVFVFKEIAHFLQKNRVILPAYTMLQELIGSAITSEEKRLSALISECVNSDIQKQLNELLEVGHSLHEITYLKKEPKDFGANQMKLEIKKLKQILPIYEVAKEFLPKLQISNASIKYYASLVDYYTIYKLKRMNRNRIMVYLICFVYYRFRKMNDHLVECLIHHMSNYTFAGKQSSKILAYEQQSANAKQFKKAAKIFELFKQEKLSDCLFSEIREMAYEILPQEQFNALIDYFKSQKVDLMEFEWEYYVKIAATFKRNIRPLLLNLHFAANSKADSLLLSIQFIKEQLAKNGTLHKTKASLFPLGTIPKSVQPYLFGKPPIKVLDIDKYEFLLYQQLNNACEAGNIFIQDSNKYRNFDDDLVSESVWQNKTELLQNLGLDKLTMPIEEILANLEKELEYWLERVNRRITNKENTHIKLVGKGKNLHWSLPYTKLDDLENHAVFSKLPHTGIADLLVENNKFCEFIDCFTPMVIRYNKPKFEQKSLIASLIAMGTYIGLGEMGEISDISYNSLASTSHSLIRLETLRLANDKVSNAIAKLAICKYYNIMDEIIHASTDGSKIETMIDTFNSRHSSKYFGVNKGVSAMTLVANHIPINAKLIGAHEHESHFIFDLLFNNTSDIRPNILSTDTHGANAVNFAILYLFDYIFAPRYKDTGSKLDNIYGFRHKRAYADMSIQPVRKINTQLIIDEWEQIKKIMLSLATKSTTQSIIIGKLSAHERTNRTKSALCEFDNIIRSIHLLKYIDDMGYRQSIQKALNRGESYHKLRRAISYANGGKLRVQTEMSQQIYNECGRLLANNIILYNARLLSKFLATLEKSGNKAEIEQLKRISPVAWRHINIYGHYEFNRAFAGLPMDDLVAKMNLNFNQDEAA